MLAVSHSNAYDKFLLADPLRIKPSFVVEGPTTRMLHGSLYLQFAVHRRGAPTKLVFIPGSQFERDPDNLMGITDDVPRATDSKFFCSRDGSAICMSCRVDRDDGLAGRMYYWRAGMANAKPLTDTYPDFRRVAAHMTRDGKTIWLARLNGHIVTISRLTRHVPTLRPVAHFHVDSKIDRFPPFAFSEITGGMRVLLGTSSFRVLTNGQVIKESGQCPFDEDNAHGLRFYRDSIQGGVRVSIEHRGRTVSKLIFHNVSPVSAIYQVAVYVDDQYIEVKEGSQLRVLRQKTFKDVKVPSNCQIVLENRTLAFMPHAEWGYYLVSGSLYHPSVPLTEDDDSPKISRIQQFERSTADDGFSYLAAIGTRYGVIQIYPGSDGEPDIIPQEFHAYFLAPADDRGTSTP